MGLGRGKGGDQTGAIAAGCGAIYCMVCFFLFGLPMLIAGIVLVRIAAGDYDDSVKESIETCLKDSSYDWDPFGSRTTTPHEWSWNSHDDSGCLDWDDWEEAKGTMRTIGIVLIVLALLSVVAGIVLILLMFTSLCKKSGGTVQYQHGAPPNPNTTVVYGPTTQVAYPPQQGQQAYYPSQPQPYPTQPYAGQPAYPPQAGYPVKPPQYPGP